ncbi:MAG TPA: helix-turn-helix domain-containing protein [Thermoleophilaceae bacterium]
MARTSFSQMTCSVARTAEVVGDWWTPLILRDLAIGISRFDALQDNLGVSRKVLTDRLAALAEHGVVAREPYQEKPTRYDYFLTEKGVDLAMVLLAMAAWGDRWVFGEGSEPVLLRHDACGEVARPVMTCSCCGEPLRAGEFTPFAGPGLADGPGTRRTREALERLGALRAGAA